MGFDYLPASRLQHRRLALVISFLLMISVLVATPALAAKGGKKGGGEDTTTTTTVPDTTTTTVASEPTDFVQWEDASALTNYAHGQYEGSMFWVTNRHTGAMIRS